MVVIEVFLFCFVFHPLAHRARQWDVLENSFPELLQMNTVEAPGITVLGKLGTLTCPFF